MKAVLLSDTHQLHNEIEVPDGDILIHAGDFSAYGNIHEALEFKEWVQSLPHTYKIVIGGNHDWRLRQTYKKLFHSFYYLEHESMEIEGKTFFGSPWTPIIQYDKPWVYPRKSVEAYELWAKIPNNTDILITHGPPFGILDTNMKPEFCGCPVLLDRVLDIKPKYHIFGHLHENGGRFTSRYNITFINCSVLNEEYKLENKPMVIDI